MSVHTERDHAHDVLRALRLAGHIPDGGWRRLVNGVVALESESDIEDAEARAMSIVWDVEQRDHTAGGNREAWLKALFLHFTYQVAAFSNDPALVQRAAEFHYQFGRHIPTPQPGGCHKCEEAS